MLPICRSVRLAKPMRAVARNVHLQRRSYSRIAKPQGLVLPNQSKTMEFIRLDGKKVDLSAEEQQKIAQDLWVLPDFITKEEEHQLIEEINPLFKKKRYIDTHWDGVITGYKEIEKSFWVRLTRILTLSSLYQAYESCIRSKGL